MSSLERLLKIVFDLIPYLLAGYFIGFLIWILVPLLVYFSHY